MSTEISGECDCFVNGVGEEDVIIDVLPGGAREDRLVIAEETEPRVDVEPELRIEVRVNNSTMTS